MDGDVLSLSSSPLLSSSAAVAAETEETSLRSDSSLFQGQQEHRSAEALWYVRSHVYTQKQEHLMYNNLM